MTQSTIELLNSICDGWKDYGRMLINSKNGDIIDFAPAVGKWFIIGAFGVFEGYETREDAVKAYIEKTKSTQKTDGEA